MELTNKYGLHDVICEAVRMDPYDRGGDGTRYISVTELVAPPQLTKLRWAHQADLSEDVSERIWALLGQSVHSVIERAVSSSRLADKVIAEQRFYAEVAGWRIGGQVDIYDIERQWITDFKITSYWATKGEMKTAWRRQLNLLAYLLRANGHPVQGAEITAILRDWSRTKSKYDADYPDHPSITIQAEMVDDEVIEAFIRLQLRELEKEEPRECSDEERWRSGGNWAVMRGDSVKWAVMRPGRKAAIKIYEIYGHAVRHAASEKGLYIDERRDGSAKQRRAVKLFDTLLEAEQFIAAHPEGGFRLEGRESVYERCESYCPVRGVCRQAAGDSQVFGERSAV